MVASGGVVVPCGCLQGKHLLSYRSEGEKKMVGVERASSKQSLPLVPNLVPAVESPSDLPRPGHPIGS